MGRQNNTNPTLYLVVLTSSGGAKGFRTLPSLLLRKANPSFPRIATAMIIKSSGIPNASKPDRRAMSHSGRPEVKTRGIKTGLIIPIINIAAPEINLPFGGLMSVGSVSVVGFIFIVASKYRAALPAGRISLNYY